MVRDETIKKDPTGIRNETYHINKKGSTHEQQTIKDR